MKKKPNKLSVGGSILIVMFFIMSFIWPSTQLFAKIGAILVFAFISFAPLYVRKKNGKKIGLEIIVNGTIVAFISYLLFL